MPGFCYLRFAKPDTDLERHLMHMGPWPALNLVLESLSGCVRSEMEEHVDLAVLGPRIHVSPGLTIRVNDLIEAWRDWTVAPSVETSKALGTMWHGVDPFTSSGHRTRPVSNWVEAPVGGIVHDVLLAFCMIFFLTYVGLATCLYYGKFLAERFADGTPEELRTLSDEYFRAAKRAMPPASEEQHHRAGDPGESRAPCSG
jgi:hypothetical protein